MKTWVKLVTVGASLLIIDVFTKLYVVYNIAKMSWLHPFYPYGGIGVFKNALGIDLTINYVENKGAAWGCFSAYSNVLFYLRIFIVLSLVIFLIYSKFPFKKALPFCLIITGAVGNILDYIFYGHVVDMIHFKVGSYSYPVFNFADMIITMGILWVFFSLFKKQ